MTSSVTRYEEASRFLNSLVDYEKTGGCFGSSGEADLKAFRSWMEHLGQPQKAFPSVLISGTKGKGSTAAVITSIARAAGLRVGLYTSPHLETFRERIRVGGRTIAPDAFARLAFRLRDSMGSLREKTADLHSLPIAGRSTVFELLTAMAFITFAENGVDLAVLEVGMGGRLDATNVVDPLVSVITPVSLDHTQVLGNSIKEIAREKGGIIRPGGLVVTGPQAPEADGALDAICRERRARRVRSEKSVSFDRTGRAGRRRLSLRGREITVENVRFPLRGAHQAENAATALAVIEVLRDQGMSIHPEDVQRGLERVRWPGRFEVFKGPPCVVLDGAHNTDSFQKLVATLTEEFPGRRVVFVIGLARDKDVRGCMKIISPMASALIATQTASPRARPAGEIAEAADGRMPRVDVEIRPAEALRRAFDLAESEDVICVTGSLYLVGELRRGLVQARSAGRR